MASGRPILAMINGEARALIAEARCGLTCPAGDYISFAACIEKLSQMSEQERIEMGSNGRKYFEANFAKDKCINHLECLITR